MQSLRMLVLMLAVGAFPPLLMQAHGQQEIDPNHFDQPPAAKANGYNVKAHTNHRVATADNQAPKHVSTASKHAGRKSNHHQGQAFQNPFIDRELPFGSRKSAEARAIRLAVCEQRSSRFAAVIVGAAERRARMHDSDEEG